MANENVSSISQARSYEEMAEFWDTHSVADYEDQIEEVEMTFDPSARRTTVGVEPDLYRELCAIAKQRKISIQTLVNVWLSQRVENINAKTTE